MLSARMKQPVFVLPEALTALKSLSDVVTKSTVPQTTVELINMRASQINGCGVCGDGHWRIARQLGESDERLFAVAAWRETPYFTDAERAALALTEAVTRIADTVEPVSDATWDEAVRHYDEEQLAAIVLAIASINVWNRLNVATRQVAAGTEGW
jgi:AhpD family alkylhydroperoxidase